MSRLLLVVVVFSFAIIITGINRGFDFSDEGLYVFLADPSQDNVGGIFNYDLFFKLLDRLIGVEFGIMELRIIRLFSYLAGAWALSIFWKNTNSEKIVSLEVYLLAVMGLFAGYAFLPPSLSYNSISVVLACFWLAVISKKEKQWTDPYFLGVILGLLFYVKITSCLVLGCLTLIILVYKRVFNWKLIPGLVLPFLIFECVFFIFFRETGISRIVSGLVLMSSREDYGYVLLFKYLAVGIFWIILAFVPFWIAGFFHRKSRVKSIFFAVLGILSLISIFTMTAITDEWNHSVLLVSTGILGFVVGKYGLRNLNTEQRLSIFLLIGMPFFLYIGSNVYWLRLGVHYWVFWIFAVMMYFPMFPIKIQNGLKGGIAIFSLIVMTNGIWINPFEQETLWKADQPWEYGSGKSILLSRKQVDLLTKLKEKTDLYSNEQVLVFYRIPGILYLVDKNSPKSPGYWSRSHLISYFPNGVDFDVLLYAGSDSLPPFDGDTFQKDQFQMPSGEEIQVLWR